MSVLTGRGGAAIQGETSELFSSVFIPLGSRGNDANGNEYIFVDFGSSQPTTGFHYGEFVCFDNAYLCTRLSATTIGNVGVVMAGSAAVTITTTLRYGWVMVYGIHTAAWGDTSLTSAITAHPLYAPVTTDLGWVGARGVTTSVASVIYGARACSAPDSCASTALSTSALAAPFTVQLCYPFINGSLNVHGTS
jgi:hypothetical protein